MFIIPCGGSKCAGPHAAGIKKECGNYDMNSHASVVRWQILPHICIALHKTSSFHNIWYIY